MRRLWLGLLMLLVIACSKGDSGNTTAPITTGTVYFKIDALSCGAGTAAVQFFIDGTVVGTETIASGTLSKGYTTSGGAHFLGAKAVASGYTWPTTQFTVPSGGTYTLLLTC